MCKAWMIQYTCAHTYYFRLSTCRGTFSRQSRKTYNVRACCSSNPLFTLKSSLECGDCAREAVESEAEAKKITELDMWFPDLRREHDEKLWQLRSAFPAQRFEKAVKVESREKVRGQSHLRNEVKREEAKDARVQGWGWYDDWGPYEDQRYPSLEEEIAEDLEGRDTVFKEYEADMEQNLRRWNEDRPLELAEGERSVQDSVGVEVSGFIDAGGFLHSEGRNSAPEKKVGSTGIAPQREIHKLRSVLPPHERHRQRLRGSSDTGRQKCSDTMPESFLDHVRKELVILA